MNKRTAALLAALCLLASAVVGGALPASAAANTIADSRSFSFSGAMSKKVLRSYCAHAVTLAGFAVEGLTPDNNFEEDLRMITDMGAKFIGRAAYYSWSGNLSAKQIDQHFKLAKERAAAAHKADPELILQAGVFEIAYSGAVEAQAIPAYVFEAFGLPVEKRNFRFQDMIWETGEYAYANSFWGSKHSCVPNITKTETQMYFYYQITRYIDAGYESVHLGQAGMMANHATANNVCWDRVTTLARQYAKSHARRGIVLFDCHVSLGYQMKVDNRLIMDIFAGGITPNETKSEDEAQKCEVVHYKVNPQSCVGRAPGGKHPLGFDCDQQYTILEFDNYGGNGRPGVATPKGFYNWGYDDVTWFALQPEWYRNQFLAETQRYLSTNADTTGKGGEQVCFIQFSCRRVITEPIRRLYYVNGATDVDAVLAAVDKEQKTTYEMDSLRNLLTFTVASSGMYRANRQSDACPTGSNQEPVIKAIMAGQTVDKAYFDHNIERLSAKNHGKATSATAPAGGKTTVPAKTTKGEAATTGGGTVSGAGNGTGGSPDPGTPQSDTGTAASGSGSDDTTTAAGNETPGEPPADDTDSQGTGADAGDGFPVWPIAVAGVVIAAGAAAVPVLWIKRKKG